jgi:hypothetical protein
VLYIYHGIISCRQLQKSQITSTKLQINSNFEISMTKTVWDFGFWSLGFV